MQYDVIILGAGAAGMMCAIEAGKRGRRAAVIDHSSEIGRKIKISGGGRCNFTNLHATAANYLSSNRHFSKSALARFTPHDIVAIVESHGIAYHEKKLGQLFCDDSAQNIIDILVTEATNVGVKLLLNTTIGEISHGAHYEIATSRGSFSTDSLVVATGGLSIPKIGATNFGYQLAKQFGHTTTPLYPALVGLAFSPADKETFNSLSGIAFEVEVTCNEATFRENLLFTHRGLSGPVILQISSFWQPGAALEINLLPNLDARDWLQRNRKGRLVKLLGEFFPRRFCELFARRYLPDKPLAQFSRQEMEYAAKLLNHWQVIPADSEGYRKAEVTCGGVNTRELSSKTLESRLHPGLYFIGEVVDVTGWLGGYNFQWAWASGWAAGQVV